MTSHSIRTTGSTPFPLGEPNIPALILHWCNNDRSLSFSQLPDVPEDYLAVCFSERETPVEFELLELHALMEQIPHFEALDESIYRYSDQEGYRPNDEWFEQRNRKLSLIAADPMQLLEGPLSASSELILSYALSSGGLAVVTSVLDGELTKSGSRIHADGYLLSLVFLGEHPGQSEVSWLEEILLPYSFF